MIITKFLKPSRTYPQLIQPENLIGEGFLQKMVPSGLNYLGCLPNYRALYDLVLTKGRFINDQDNRDESEVCVLASSLARTLFPFGDSLGKPVNIGGNLYVVVGEVAPRTNLNDTGDLGFKELFEDNVYLPLSTHWAKIFRLLLSWL